MSKLCVQNKLYVGDKHTTHRILAYVHMQNLKFVPAPANTLCHIPYMCG